MYKPESANLFYKDSSPKRWQILVKEGNVLLDNSKIVSDTLRITENLCSKEDITLGSCEASQLEVQIVNFGTKLIGKTLIVSLFLGNIEFKIGTYKVAEETLEENQRFRSITAYDYLYDINQRNVARWFNTLKFPMTLKQFRDSFFDYIGVEQEEIELINDDIPFDFKATNSAQTNRQIDEESEKVDQLITDAIYGVKTARYTLIDPNTYDTYPEITENEYEAISLTGYYASNDKTVKSGKTYYSRTIGYDPVTPEEGDDPFLKKWWVIENNVYVRTKDREVKPGVTYFTRTYVYTPVTPEQGDNPKLKGWYEKVTADTNPKALKWLEIYGGNYIETKDKTIYVYNAVTPNPGDNPHDLGWWEKSADTYTKVTPQEGDNPKDKEWYEKSGDAYFKTNHTTVQPGTDYYKRTSGTYSETTDTTVQENKTYYTKDLTTKTYFTSISRSYRSPDKLGWYERSGRKEDWEDNRDYTYLKITPQLGDNPASKHWFEVRNPKYVKSTDSVVDFLKDYFEKLTTYEEVIPSPGDNPAQKDWYEKKGDNYEKTTDTEVKSGTTYYKKRTSYNKVATSYIDNPVELEWYEYKNASFVETEDTTVQQNKNYYAKSAVYDQYDGSFTPSIDQEINYEKDYYLKQEVIPKKPTFELVDIPEGSTQVPAEEGWWIYDEDEAEYERSDDLSIKQGRQYYKLIAPENDNTAFFRLDVSKHSRENPEEQGWYELVNQAFVHTTDQTVDFTKVYYQNIYEYNKYERKNTITDNIPGSNIVGAICEINGCFGHMDRNGVFKYVKVKPIDYNDEGLYPKPDLYPDPNLYPVGAPADFCLERSMYEEIEVEDYYIPKINRLAICKEDGDIGYVYPRKSSAENYFITEDIVINQNKDYYLPIDPDAEILAFKKVDTSLYPGANPHDLGWYEYTLYNTYKITGNFIWYNFTGNRETLDTVGDKLLTYGVANISEYRPCSIKTVGNPCIEVGDTLKIKTRTGIVYTYVMSRTFEGSQRLKDSIEAKGNKQRGETDSVYDAVIELKGKANLLERSVDETKSQLTDISEGLTSLIQQTAESISLAVSREVKGLDKKVQEKYEAATVYTDRQISSMVSHEIYDTEMNAVQEWKSQFNMTPTEINASVENMFPKKGEGSGFAWSLTSNSFTLMSKGGYARIPMAEKEVEGVNPHDRGWLEFKDYEYKLTDDTEVELHKAYYRAVPVNEYNDVFVCDAFGVKVNGFVNAEDLYASEQITAARIDAMEAHLGQVFAKKIDVEGPIAAHSAAIEGILDAGYITADTVKTVKLNANQIDSGKVDARFLDVDSITTAVIGGMSDPEQGTITMGNIRASHYFWYANRERPYGLSEGYHAIEPKMINGNLVLVVK